MFANVYIKHGDMENANQVYHKATQINFKTLEELSKVWASWIEVHLLRGFVDDAFVIIKQALFKRANKDKGPHDKKETTESIGMSMKLWQLYIDMEHNFGTIETIKAAYKRMMEIKVITPQILLNYAAFLQSMTNKIYLP
jgi:pre-mRNA-splicing factor SYF1